MQNLKRSFTAGGFILSIPFSFHFSEERLQKVYILKILFL